MSDTSGIIGRDTGRPPKGNASALIEQGTAFMALEGADIRERRGGVSAKLAESAPEKINVIVIGAGQAGLSTGYHLARHGVDFAILEANERVGDVWRRRWDSLRLFTPARFNGLDGMPFPAPSWFFPTKEEMADYLEAYAARFNLPVRTATRVTHLTRRGERYILTAGDKRFSASQVIVAAASYQKPRVPAFAADLDPTIKQIHSVEYRNPAQLNAGNVLIVGAGNSGAEIARELAPKHRIYMAGRDVGEIPFRIDGFVGRHGMVRLVLRVLFHRVFSVKTPIGRKMRPMVVSHGGPLIRVKRRDLADLGVEFVPRLADVEDGKPKLADGHVLDVANVVWCTGFHPGLDWIDLPIFGEHGHPKHEHGFVPDEPGLAFVGLHFQRSLSSAMVHGVGRDARIAAEMVARRLKAMAPAA